ncbi:MAG: asparaginase [bacterium]|jgi:L-asparaginase
MTRRRIKLIATGGTIATVYKPELGGLAAGLSGEDVLVEPPPGVEVEVEDFARINSTYLRPQDMLALSLSLRQILAEEKVDGVVVTHGTSTLEETAFFLDVTVPGAKPVVLTGAQRAASEPWPDGPANLAAALQVAAAPESRERGTLVTFAGEVHPARSVRKVHTTSLRAFASGEAGLLGTVDSSGVHYWRDLPPLRRLPVSRITEPVDLVVFTAGMDARHIEASIATGAAGIVVSGVGMGNVNEEFYWGIKKARDAGLVVVMVSRSPDGRVAPRYGYLGGGASLVREGVIFGGALSGPQARLLLMIGLGAGLDHEEMTELFNQY